MDAKEVLQKVKFSCEQVDQKQAPWAEEYRPHWILRFSYGCRRTRFDFWNNYKNEEPEKYAMLSMLLSDATSGLMDVDEFAAEMGYDKPSVAIKTWKACQVVGRKLRRLFDCTGDELYDLVNMADELQD